MGIRFTCPNGHKLHVKAFLAGKRGVCPQCGAKILIPAILEPQQVGVRSPDFGQSNHLEATGPKSGPTAEVGSPSIIIAVADVPVASPQPIEAGRTGDSSSTSITVDSPPALHNSTVVSEFIAPVSPAARYVAHRERGRRNQMTMAVLLLLAVIVLAVALIWVLQRGSGRASAGQIKPNTLANCGGPPYVAVSFDHFKNAHIDQATHS